MQRLSARSTMGTLAFMAAEHLHLQDAPQPQRSLWGWGLAFPGYPPD